MTIYTLNLPNSALSLQVNETFCPWRDSSSEQQWWKWPLFFLLFLVANICYGQTNTERGLVLYCPFSNSFDDQGPAKNTLAPHNVQFVEGIDGSGVSFDGKDSYLDIPDNPSLNFDESDFSISFWLEFSYLPDGYALLLSKCNESTYPFRGISFFVGDLENGKMLFRTSAECQLYEQSNNLNTSLWKYVVLSRREKYLEIYLDGELVSTSSFPLTNVTNKGNFRIGCNHIDPKSQRYNGKLDELRIYNRALSADEISELYNRHSSMGVVGVLTSFAIVFAGILAFFYNRHKRRGLPFSLDTIDSFGTGLKISLSLVYGLVIYLLIFPLTSTFTDRAFFGGDTWEYQSMAVNFAKDHGIQKFGQIEKFDQYKFDRQDERLLTSFENSSYDGYPGVNIGRNDFYRTPGYPLFIGIIYKLFGVSPWIAKQIQLILLIVISSFLPWIGTYFWGRTGFWSGFAAGVLYISMYYNSAEGILTEPLISFSIFLVIVAFINFMKGKSTFLSCVLLGASLGLSLLVKGSLIFLPFLFAAGMLWQAYKQKSIELFKRLVIVGASLALTILPWSIYASITNGHPIILSTQGEAVLLDGNNEYSTDGAWHPEWRSNQNHFYNREDVKNLSSPIRLIKFYASHREVLLQIFKYKVMRAFTPFYGLWIILILLIIDYWSSKIRQFSNFGYIIFMSISFLASLMFIVLPFLQSSADKLFVLSRNNLNDNLFFYVILLGTLIALVIDRKARLSIKFPLILTIFFLNFLMLTLIAFGDPRFVAVMDFIFLLCAIQYLTLMLISFYKKGSAPGMNNSN